MFTIKIVTEYEETKAISEKVFSSPIYEKYTYGDGSVEVFFSEVTQGAAQGDTKSCKGVKLSNQDNQENGVTSMTCYIENMSGKTIDKFRASDKIS